MQWNSLEGERAVFACGICYENAGWTNRPGSLVPGEDELVPARATAGLDKGR